MAAAEVELKSPFLFPFFKGDYSSEDLKGRFLGGAKQELGSRTSETEHNEVGRRTLKRAK
jgi:hypothetical protein